MKPLLAKADVVIPLAALVGAPLCDRDPIAATSTNRDAIANPAALDYFGKSVHELTINEAAYLAALPKGPNNYHPYRKTQAALDRRNEIIRLMAENGYITKEAPSEQFLVSLRRVLNGDIYVSEAVGHSMIRKFAAGESYLAADPIERLSNRELQVLLMIGKGMSTRESAHALHLSVKTVESHRQRIKRKLNLRTGLQLVHYALQGNPKRGE